MISKISSFLHTYQSVSNIISSAIRNDKIYEIYILMLVVDALENLGATFSIRDNKDRVVNNLIFRLAPGSIWSPSNNAGFINFVINDREYELHNGVRIQGKSGVLHEADISIIEKSAASNCRNNRVHPRSSKTKMLIECKFYGTNLPLNLGREFLGLTSEFSGRVKTLISNSTSNEIFDLIKSHKGTTNFDVSILNKHKIIIFIKWLEKELEHVL